MILSDKQWKNIANHCRSKIVHLTDPTALFVENTNLREELEMPHKGFYIGIIDSSDNELMREGFLSEEPTNVLESADKVSQSIVNRLKDESISISKVKTSTFYFSVITDVVYLPDPLQWEKEGIFFSWGDYKSMLLPYEIKRMNAPKIEIMDKLTTGTGLFSSAWRNPVGLCWKLITQSYHS